MEGLSIVTVTVFWCLAGTPLDAWDPHHPNPIQRFVAAANKGDKQQCFADGPTQLEPGVSLEQCRSQAMVKWLPGWQQKHPNEIFIGVGCETRVDDRERLDLRALKNGVSP